MLISHCSWHRKYYGWPRLMGVSRWRPFWKLEWTSGMCTACAAKFRAINDLKKRSA